MRADSLAALGRWPAARSWPWYLAGALIYLSFGFTEMMGSDLWWHIAAGREIVQSGSVWLVDDWSFTELGSPWRNHEWLADLIFYAWVSLFGIPSLVLWKWLLIVGSFSLLQSVLERVSGSPAAAMLACALAVAVAAPFMDMRPQLYTHCCANPAWWNCYHCSCAGLTCMGVLYSDSCCWGFCAFPGALYRWLVCARR
jgi:hypothetical protein